MPESSQATIAVLVLDDHAVFRESVARLLHNELGFEVTHCGSIDEALAVLRHRRIDIVLLDFDLGKETGTEFMRLAKKQGFAGKVLVVTAGIEEADSQQLIRAGIAGIFMKHSSAAMLAEGIRQVMAGKVWFDQEVLLSAVASEAKPRLQPSAERLTQREKQVLSHVFEGLSNKEIAGRLGVSETSVKATLQQLFSKTGVRTRTQLVRIALEQYKNQL
jgi:two-component system, NarL family, nitrate/nitrite response regulator NarL